MDVTSNIELLPELPIDTKDASQARALLEAHDHRRFPVTGFLVSAQMIGNRVRGRILGDRSHRRSPNGTRITSGSIIEINAQNDMVLALTVSGSRYRLLSLRSPADRLELQYFAARLVRDERRHVSERIRARQRFLASQQATSVGGQTA